ncbi:MAG: MucBP domain-containing protein, partial [Oscillospiraceae bacterium]|nr:MucBP domain-containing protein [Oscillospiraceae bacterium]
MRKIILAKILLFFLVFSEMLCTIDCHKFFAYQVSPVSTSVVNGGFETKPTKTNVTAVASYQLNQSEIEGWLTTATDSLIEIWRSGFKPGTPGAIAVPAHSGNFFAEINGTMAATLYQDIATKPGTIYKWSFWHRGRNGIDEAQILLGIPGSTQVAKDINGNSILADGKGTGGSTVGWGFHEGYYTTPGTLTESSSNITLRLQLKAYSSSDGLIAQGNFVDDVNFIPVCDPTIQRIHLGDPKPLGSTLANLVSLPPSVIDTTGVNLKADYAEDSEYTLEDGITPPDLSVPGTHLVKVKITDSIGNFVGYTISTIIVETTLTVNYFDQNDEPIADSIVQNFDNVDPYDFSNDGEVTINEITYKVLKTTGDPVEGVMDADKTINFYLAPPQTVTVNYLDQKGNPVKDPDVQNLYNGDSYSVTNPGEITVDGVTYEIVNVTGDPLTGTLDSDKVINFYLSPPQTVTVNYLDQKGDPIADPNVLNLNNGDPYDVSNDGEITIGTVTYKVEKTDGDPVTGVADTDKVVNFYLIPPQTVTVNYIDKNGNPVKEPSIQNLYNGDPYSVTNPGEIIINGVTYEIVNVTGDPLTGTADTDKVINFELVPPQTVTVNYLDQDGNKIADPNILDLNKDDPYSITNPGEITIDGVTYKVVDITGDPLSGTADADKTINFYLAPPQTVTVNYLDKNGNSLIVPSIEYLYNGDPYDITNPGEVIIDGITYKVVDITGDPLTGTVDTDKTINFYLAQPQTVTVNYLDQDGKPITDPNVQSLYNGDPYSVTNPGEMIIDGVTYKVVKTDGDPLTGTLDTDKMINFYLAPPQTVTVNYLDQNGKPIKDPNILNLNNGDPYDVSNDGEVVIDGVTYKVVKTEGDPVTGVADSDKTINFYLAQPQTVTVNYLDKNGKPITDPNILNLNNGDSYDVSNDGEVVIDGVTYKVVKTEGDPVTGIADSD